MEEKEIGKKVIVYEASARFFTAIGKGSMA
jgi:hypothetical protein